MDKPMSTIKKKKKKLKFSFITGIERKNNNKKRKFPNGSKNKSLEYLFSRNWYCLKINFNPSKTGWRMPLKNFY